MKSKSVTVSPGLRARYEARRAELEKAGTQDPDNATLPIEFWEQGTVGKHYRPLKTPISLRVDNAMIEDVSRKR